MPDEVVYQVFNYVEDSFINVPVGGPEDTCEHLCRWICQRLKIKPLVFSLVGLRIHGERWFLAGCTRPSPEKKYDFRVRFKVPDLSTLKTLDQELFNYYYNQLRYDLLHNRIPEIDYQKYKNKILGYVVNDMYRKMIEDEKIGLNELKRDFEKYIPRKINKQHSVCFFNFAEKRIFQSLSSLQQKDHDVNYVKNVYINDIDNIAPGYLYEEYAAEIQYPRGEFSSRTGKCPVKLRFQPYGSTAASRDNTTKYGSTGGGLERMLEADDATATPGLKVFYSCKWQHVTNIDEILTILVEKLTVKLALEDQTDPYCIDFRDQTELHSFVTCLAGYYRLMCKWTVYLCQGYLSSPMLDWLKDHKCHGPIGGKYSTDKIRQKNSSCGACIIRQCEKHYDTYYVDMLEGAGQIKTYKMIYSDDQWHVQREKEKAVEHYNQLAEALKSLNPEITSVYRLPPSDNDNAPNLLLCRPTQKSSPKRVLGGGTQELGLMKRAGIINAAKELVVNRNASEDESDGFTKRTRADFLLPNNSKMEVTLKLLKNDREGEYLKDFLQMAGQWATIDSIDIIKLYGMTLCKPITMVLEYPRFGRLDEFLRMRRNIPAVALIEVGHSLARALYYLQKHGIIHGHIRCSTMQVINYDASGHRILAKLGDPGMNGQRRLTKEDLLWIPYEYQDLSEHSVAKLRHDPASDAWSCTSALWEIFSRGRKMHVHKPAQFLPSRKWRDTMVPELKESKQIYECLNYGWHADPDKRLAPQTIVGLLVHARQMEGSYCTVENGYVNGHSNGTLLNETNLNSSIISMETTSTLVRSRTEYTSSSYVSNLSESELHSNTSSGGSSSHPLLSNHANCFSGDSFRERTFYDCPDYIQHGNARIVFHNTLGEGHYGRVYRGTLEKNNDSFEVALKTIQDDRPDRSDLKRVRDDFRREVDIMKGLRHKNIVRFIMFIEELDKLVVVMEYVPKGSLLSYLGYQRPTLEEKDLLQMARDIANGMQYLFEKKIVHRDLAARNILVGDDCVKISDFGLAQVTEGSNYYVARHTRDLPIKWYAPETLETQKYSFQSDVWSFGVTLYEMFTFGETPYSNVDVQSGEQLYQLLQREKKILQLPGDLSYVYDKVMAPCFMRNPHERISFSELLDQLDEMLNEYGELMQ
ncbi:tyrosine-protein kinase hopscotch [Anopheles ziemanni]|uniref:tyrosine-protein kinase hopscotch n=1 Tax=Anopheles ziemanni TaxID=345580 RepID=UPI00265FCDC2|nr:tyrosine-protein kinase hopscotch [Anopheles ziemanni]